MNPTWFSSRSDGDDHPDFNIKDLAPGNYVEYRQECWRSIHQSGTAVTMVLNWSLLLLGLFISSFFYPLPLLKLFVFHLLIYLGEVLAKWVVGRCYARFVGVTICLSFLYLSLVAGVSAAFIDSSLPVCVFWSLGLCIVVGTVAYPNQISSAASLSMGVTICFLTAYFLNFAGPGGVLNLALVLFFLTACAVTIYSSFSLDTVLAEGYFMRRRMEEARRQLAVTLHDIGDGVVTTDSQGRIVLFNRKAQEMTGWSEGEVRGRLVEEVLPWACLGSKKKCREPRELLIQNRKGEELWVSINVTGLDGDILSFQDISARKRAEAGKLIASKMEGLSLLAGGIAHDFNNFLSVIRGHATLLLDSSPVDTDVHQAMEGIEAAAVRANKLANQLLTFAKGGAPSKEIHSVADLVSESLHFALSGSTVRLETDFPKELWNLEVDGDQMAQVFQNLALNSLQAMPEGGVLTVKASNVEKAQSESDLGKERYICIELSDTGRGISPDTLPKIFDPYFSTKPGGTGLGLATAYSIISRHQGRIEVDSTEGVGTNFHIYLPATELTGQEAADPHSCSLKRGGRVLVMDDEGPLRRVLSRMLERLGFSCVATENGEEAIRAFLQARKEERPFCCVILDLTIPRGLGGQETLQELRKLEPEVIAIVASGYATETVMANYQSWGFKVRLPKPFGLSQLDEALRQALVEPESTKGI